MLFKLDIHADDPVPVKNIIPVDFRSLCHSLLILRSYLYVDDISADL